MMDIDPWAWDGEEANVFELLGVVVVMTVVVWVVLGTIEAVQWLRSLLLG